MRIIRWLRLSWWQRTQIGAFAIAGIGVIAAFVLVIVLAGISQIGALARVQFLAVTAFPLVVVLLIASLVRLQKQTNLRSGSNLPTSNADKRSVL